MFRESLALKAAGLAAVGVVASLTMFTPANAATGRTCASLPDGRGYGCIYNDGKSAIVHDSKADGWGVRIHVLSSISGTKYVVGDGNGSASGDGSRAAGANESFTNGWVCAGANNVDTVCTSYIW